MPGLQGAVGLLISNTRVPSKPVYTSKHISVAQLTHRLLTRPESGMEWVCVDNLRPPPVASSSPLWRGSPQPGFSLQPGLGEPRSWLQFPGRPHGGPRLDFKSRDSTSSSREADAALLFISEETIWCLGIIGVASAYRFVASTSINSVPKHTYIHTYIMSVNDSHHNIGVAEIRCRRR